MGVHKKYVFSREAQIKMLRQYLVQCKPYNRMYEDTYHIFFGSKRKLGYYLSELQEDKELVNIALKNTVSKQSFNPQIKEVIKSDAILGCKTEAYHKSEDDYGSNYDRVTMRDLSEDEKKIYFQLVNGVVTVDPLLN